MLNTKKNILIFVIILFSILLLLEILGFTFNYELYYVNGYKPYHSPPKLVTTKSIINTAMQYNQFWNYFGLVFGMPNFISSPWTTAAMSKNIYIAVSTIILLTMLIVVILSWGGLTQPNGTVAKAVGPTILVTSVLFILAISTWWVGDLIFVIGAVAMTSIFFFWTPTKKKKVQPSATTNLYMQS